MSCVLRPGYLRVGGKRYDGELAELGELRGRQLWQAGGIPVVGQCAICENAESVKHGLVIALKLAESVSRAVSATETASHRGNIRMGDEFAEVVKARGAQSLQDERAGSLSLETHHDGLRVSRRTFVFLARTRYCCSGPSGFFSAIVTRTARRERRKCVDGGTREKNQVRGAQLMRRRSSPSLLSDESSGPKRTRIDLETGEPAPEPQGAQI